MEAPIEGKVMCLAVSEVPLAHQVVGVAHLAEDVGHGDVLGLQTPGVTGDKGDIEADIGGVAAGHQGGPGGGAGRVHVVVFKSEMYLSLSSSSVRSVYFIYDSTKLT